MDIESQYFDTSRVDFRSDLSIYPKIVEIISVGRYGIWAGCFSGDISRMRRDCLMPARLALLLRAVTILPRAGVFFRLGLLPNRSTDVVR